MAKGIQRATKCSACVLKRPASKSTRPLPKSLGGKLGLLQKYIRKRIRKKTRATHRKHIDLKNQIAHLVFDLPDSMRSTLISNLSCDSDGKACLEVSTDYSGSGQAERLILALPSMTAAVDEGAVTKTSIARSCEQLLECRTCIAHDFPNGCILQNLSDRLPSDTQNQHIRRPHTSSKGL
jgi:hypothetical protein